MMKPIQLVKLSLPFAFAFCLLLGWLAVVTAGGEDIDILGEACSGTRHWSPVKGGCCGCDS